MIEGATVGCRRLFEELTARDFGNAACGRVHRLMVDTFCLQHPDEYCASAKSMAAHLTGLGWLLEHDVSRAIGSEALRRWIESARSLPRPTPPDFRGAITIAEVRAAPNPEAHARAVDRWGRSTWEAYATLHTIAREWIREALDAPARPRR